ncbi:MAG: PDZ domain-containing protein [Bacteroidota bacterium]|nr:PDZ domain-containing protein [Bacteroidota bacterium]
MKNLQYILFIFIFNVINAQKGTFTEYTYKCNDSITRPYVVYKPKQYQENKPNTLVVFLHNSVSAPNIKSNPLEISKNSEWIELADEANFCILFPYGQKNASWFNSTGVDMVLAQIQSVQGQLNINPNKIILTGFAEGATGVLYFSMTNSDIFSGFIAINGSLKEADKIGELDLFPSNMNQKPFLIYNSSKDIHYSYQQHQNSAEYLQKFNNNISFREDYNKNEKNYLDPKQNEIIEFINTLSDKQADTFEFETSKEDEQFDFIQINKINTELQALAWHPTYQLRLLDDRVNLDMKYNYNTQEKNIVVTGMKKNGNAHNIGLQVEDVIIKFENDSISSSYAPFYYTINKKAGDPTEITVIRNGTEQVIKGRFNKGTYYNIFDKNKKSAKIKVHLLKNELIIETSRVVVFTVDFDKIPTKIKTININGVQQKVKYPSGNNPKIVSFTTT